MFYFEALLAAVIVLLLISIFAVGMSRCTSDNPQTEVPTESAEEAIELSAVINTTSLSDEVKEKFLKLASNEPAATDFLAGISEYPQTEATGDATFPSEESEHRAPLLYQWDTRWGYVEYSGQPFGSSGCGPTAFAMVYQGLTGNHDKSPYDMAMLAREVGYETESSGTDGRLYTEYASDLGLNCEYLYPDKDMVLEALGSGSILMFNVGEGDFTASGHYIVVCGLADNAELVVNDPYSSINSNKTWDVERVLDQTSEIYNLWV